VPLPEAKTAILIIYKGGKFYYANIRKHMIFPVIIFRSGCKGLEIPKIRGAVFKQLNISLLIL
jgi:hypothetical protein